jgi:hypothetical protein
VKCVLAIKNVLSNGKLFKMSNCPKSSSLNHFVSSDVSLENLLWAKTECEHCSQIGLNSLCRDVDATQRSIDSWPWGDSEKP